MGPFVWQDKKAFEIASVLVRSGAVIPPELEKYVWAQKKSCFKCPWPQGEFTAEAAKATQQSSGGKGRGGKGKGRSGAFE